MSTSHCTQSKQVIIYPNLFLSGSHMFILSVGTPSKEHGFKLPKTDSHLIFLCPCSSAFISVLYIVSAVPKWKQPETAGPLQ